MIALINAAKDAGMTGQEILDLLKIAVAERREQRAAKFLQSHSKRVHDICSWGLKELIECRRLFFGMQQLDFELAVGKDDSTLSTMGSTATASTSKPKPTATAVASSSASSSTTTNDIDIDDNDL
jgi:hypothetical protein